MRAIEISRLLVAALLLPAALTGCVSLAASQDRIIDPRRPDGGLPGMSVRDVLRQYDAPIDTSTTTTTTTTTRRRGNTRTTTTRVAARDQVEPAGRELRGNRTQRQWRDYVVRIYEAAISANYNDFSGRMSSERRELGLGADVVVNALTNYATVAQRSITRQLSAAASGFTGLRGAVDRNLYFDRTTSALVLSMDAERARILARIEEGLARDERAYSLHDAIRDLQLLEEAGSLDRAIGELTRHADEQRQLANRELATAVQACEVVDDSATVLTDRLSRFVHDLATPSLATASDNLAARTQALQLVGRLAGLSSDMLISASPDQIDTLIRRQLGAGVDGRCAAANYQSLIDQIKTETGRTVP